MSGTPPRVPATASNVLNGTLETTAPSGVGGVRGDSAPHMPDLLTVSAGHRRAAQQITDCIRRGQCCAFLGPRLSGMTEVLQWVTLALEQDPFCACVYIDLHRVESATRREFFASLASSAAGQSAELLGHKVATPSSEVTSGAQFRECLKACALQL
jgi:hypothetical protein